MTRSFGAMLAAAIILVFAGQGLADEPDAKAILEKGIKALGGEDKLAKAEVLSWKVKGTITFGDNDNPYSGQTTIQGLDHFRSEFEGEFNGNAIKGVTVLDGKKGWRKFGDMDMDMDDAAIANERRTIYLQVVPITLIALKGKDFKIAAAPDEKVGDKPASVLKVTGPDGKDFTIAFDKESGLPVRVVAKVAGFNGDEFTQETLASSYKDFGGIKKATKIELKRDGMKFIEQDVTDFKVLDKAPAGTFDAPK
jgi:outer membrane lipoprotein-sorting protein